MCGEALLWMLLLLDGAGQPVAKSK